VLPVVSWKSRESNDGEKAQRPKLILNVQRDYVGDTRTEFEGQIQSQKLQM